MPDKGMDIPKVSDVEHSDPEFEKVLDQIRARQHSTMNDIREMTPGKMAFGMMRHLPREKWNTPLTELGHWPRGTSIAEIRKNGELMNLTPAQAMLKLFEMDDKMKAEGQ